MTNALRKIFVRPGSETNCLLTAAQLFQEKVGGEIIYVVPEKPTANTVPNSVFDSHLSALITNADILLVDETAATHFWGPALPGYKIMYLNEFAIMGPMDGFYDTYVSSSKFVADFHSDRYGIDSAIISPFGECVNSPNPLAWENRAAKKVLVSGKLHFDVQLDLFEKMMKENHPTKDFELLDINNKTSEEQRKLLQQHRYFLWLSPNEGFGLPLLEAMMAGCTVTGFHPMESSAFAISGETCATADYPDFEKMCHLFSRVLMDDNWAKNLSENGNKMAQGFSKEKYLTDCRPITEKVKQHFSS